MPFLSFSLGYIFSFLISSHQSITVPSLIGNNISYAAKILSDAQLNLRIITQKEDADLPDGTIISQNPGAGHKIKENQAIYCIISQKPAELFAPTILNQRNDQITAFSQKEKIRIKNFFLESSYPCGLCIGQIPQPGSRLEQKILLAYIASSNSKVLFPDLYGKYVPEVIEFFQPYGFSPTIVHKTNLEQDHHCKTCRIINQKPLPGSLVDISKPLNIQIQVR